MPNPLNNEPLSPEITAAWDTEIAARLRECKSHSRHRLAKNP